MMKLQGGAEIIQVRSFPFIFTVPTIKIIPRSSMHEAGTINVHEVSIEFISENSCRIVSFYSGGNLFTTKSGCVPITIGNFEIRSITKNVEEVYDHRKGRAIQVITDVDRYTDTSNMQKQEAILNITIERYGYAIDNAELILTLNSNGDRLKLEAPAQGWKTYLYSIINSTDNRFKY
jgi:hypothetical protein